MPELSAMGGRTSGVRTIRWQVGPQSLVISYLRARRAEAVSWPRRRWKHARGRSGVLAAEAVETRTRQKRCLGRGGGGNTQGKGCVLRDVHQLWVDPRLPVTSPAGRLDVPKGSEKTMGGQGKAVDGQ